MNPECRLQDFVPDYLEEAMRSLDTNRVLSILQAVTSLLGADLFIADGMDLNNELNTAIENILNDWRAIPEDVSISFYSPFFDKTSDLIQRIVDSI